MSDTIKSRVIWRLTNGRSLSDGEIRELDALQIALDLDDNDPMWGQLAWIWTAVPRKTDFDLAAQAIVDKFRLLGDELKDSARLNGTFFRDEPMMNDIHKMLQDLVSASESRESSGAGSVNEESLKKAISSALETLHARESHPQVEYQHVDFVAQFKAAVREGLSWVWVALSGAVVGLSLTLGFNAGESAQRHSDQFMMKSLQEQIHLMASRAGHEK